MNWVVIRGAARSNLHKAKQFIAWGNEKGRPYDHRVQTGQNIPVTSEANRNAKPDHDDMCAYRLGYV